MWLVETYSHLTSRLVILEFILDFRDIFCKYYVVTWELIWMQLTIIILLLIIKSPLKSHSSMSWFNWGDNSSTDSTRKALMISSELAPNMHELHSYLFNLLICCLPSISSGIVYNVCLLFTEHHCVTMLILQLQFH